MKWADIISFWQIPIRNGLYVTYCTWIVYINTIQYRDALYKSSLKKYPHLSKGQFFWNFSYFLQYWVMWKHDFSLYDMLQTFIILNLHNAKIVYQKSCVNWCCWMLRINLWKKDHFILTKIHFVYTSAWDKKFIFFFTKIALQ